MDIVAFYREDAPDYLGRKLTAIWQWPDDQLEAMHNYIQVLFPNRDPSPITPAAPVLDEQTITAFQTDAALRENLLHSWMRMLDFYGLSYHPDTGHVDRRDDFQKKAANWLTPYNHNFLRITRILLCLKALGLEFQADAFWECLCEIYHEYEVIIGPATRAYWRDAVERRE